MKAAHRPPREAEPKFPTAADPGPTIVAGGR